jgi:hypothetical protein
MCAGPLRYPASLLAHATGQPPGRSMVNRRQNSNRDLQAAARHGSKPYPRTAEPVESVLYRHASGEPVTGSTCPVIQEA